MFSSLVQSMTTDLFGKQSLAGAANDSLPRSSAGGYVRVSGLVTCTARRLSVCLTCGYHSQRTEDTRQRIGVYGFKMLQLCHSHKKISTALKKSLHQLISMTFISKENNINMQLT